MDCARTSKGHGTPWVWYAKAIEYTLQWDILYLETPFHICCPPKQTELLRASEALHPVQVNIQDAAMTMEFNSLQAHYLVPKRGSGNFVHVAWAGSREHVRLFWTELKAHFAGIEYLQVPKPPDGNEQDQEHRL